MAVDQDQYRKKLFLVLTLLLTAGFLMTSLGSYFVSRKSLRTQILSTELPLTSDNIYSEIQKDLLRPIFISSLMANDTFLRNWMLSGEADETEIIQYLSEIKNKYNTVTSFLISEKTHNYYNAWGILKQISPSEERDLWYYRVRDMPFDYEINVDPDMGNKDTMTIFINHKVFGFQGNYLGATGVGLTIDSVRLLVEKYQKTFNRDIFFTDSKGTILISSSNMSRDVNSVRDMPGLNDLASGILSGQGSSLTYKHKGDIVHLNTRYIPELKWFLWVEQAEKGRIRQIHTALMVNLGLCLVITLLVVFLVRLLINAYRKKLEIMVKEERDLRLINLGQHDEIIAKNKELVSQNSQLNEALDQVQTLSGLIPICASCKKIRDDKGYWEQIESYISARSSAEFSHSLCPDCIQRIYPELEP
ncbi:MAG: cache domain-containing protein [Proteobacteria bacterium]|nr:cache domain-containing protein [Pseudomonadota bacterium]